MEKLIKIGTRGSQLALWQANYVAERLKHFHLQSEIKIIETKGDKNLSQPFAAIGTKGIFTEEIEAQLLSGEIDIAVHSAKDMQSNLGPDLAILAFTEREEANDVVVSLNENFNLRNNISAVVGTSSARRKAILKAKYPGIKTTEARGNLQTRIRKMQEGQYEAMILAYAGIHRMQYNHLIREKLSLETFIPAVGQGSIAIEVANVLDVKIKEVLKRALNNEDTESCIKAERAFLRTLEGGCSIPIFAYGTIQKNQLSLTGGIYNLDGSRTVQNIVSGARQDAEKLGIELAQLIIDGGGDKILKEIKLK